MSKHSLESKDLLGFRELDLDLESMLWMAFQILTKLIHELSSGLTSTVSEMTIGGIK